MKHFSFLDATRVGFRHLIKVNAATVAILPIVLLQGCSSTGGKAAAMNGTAPTGQRAAKSGDIQKGFSKDAVYAAWGAPSKTSVSNSREGVRECWTYVRTFNGYGGGYYGISRGLVHGKDDDHYIADDFYPAPNDSQTLGGTPATDVPVKRVIFQNGRVINYETIKSDQKNYDDYQ